MLAAMRSEALKIEWFDLLNGWQARCCQNSVTELNTPLCFNHSEADL
jgi:hypothetical protein